MPSLIWGWYRVLLGWEDWRWHSGVGVKGLADGGRKKEEKKQKRSVELSGLIEGGGVFFLTTVPIGIAWPAPPSRTALQRNLTRWLPKLQQTTSRQNVLD